MNFRNSNTDDPEINLIPMIDVLLVILIFLMTISTFSQTGNIEIKLPESSAKKNEFKNNILKINIDSSDKIVINNNYSPNNKNDLSIFLQKEFLNNKNLNVVFFADENVKHKTIIDIMDVLAGLNVNNISFATKSNKNSH